MKLQIDKRFAGHGRAGRRSIGLGRGRGNGHRGTQIVGDPRRFVPDDFSRIENPVWIENPLHLAEDRIQVALLLPHEWRAAQSIAMLAADRAADGKNRRVQILV